MPLSLSPYSDAWTKYKKRSDFPHTSSHCVWQSIFRNSHLAEWIGHPQIPRIVKLPHALLVPTVCMYTLNIAEQNQRARPTRCHEIRTSSSLVRAWIFTPRSGFTSLQTVACVPVRALMWCCAGPSIHAHIVNCNIWPRVERILCGVSQTSRALEGTRMTEHCSIE